MRTSGCDSANSTAGVASAAQPTPASFKKLASVKSHNFAIEYGVSLLQSFSRTEPASG